MINPLVSIVVPVYNLENYIEKTLDSIFQQTYQNIEVITVNDGSKDNSAQILDKYAEKESRLVVIHKENGGVSSARIKGIELANGEFIGFIDGDDLIDNDMFERLINNALESNADISHCGYRMITDDKTEHFYNTGKRIVQDKRRGLIDLIEGKFVEPGLWNKIFRRELFECLFSEDTIMDFSFKENEDLLMNYCLFKQAEKSVFEDFCPYQYIIRNTSASHGKVNRHILCDPITIGEILINDSKDDAELSLYAARYYVVKLIKAATRSYKTNKDLKDIKFFSQKKLRNFLGNYLKINGESTSKKMLAVFAAFMPNLYRFIHKVYLK